jgi:epoxyqueuosine reductase
MQLNKHAYTNLIKTEAKKLGFMFCGMAKAEFLEEEAPRLEAWLKKGMHGEMQYMENPFIGRWCKVGNLIRVKLLYRKRTA